LGRNFPDVSPLVNPFSENLFLKVYISFFLSGELLAVEGKKRENVA